MFIINFDCDSVFGWKKYIIGIVSTNKVIL